MFLYLRRRIVRYIVLATIIFTLIIGLVSFYFISQSLYRNYINSAKENINQSIINSNFAIQTAKDTTTLISQNSNVLSAINSNKYDQRVNPVLNTLKNTSYGIIGVTLYTLDGQIYSTSSISSHLSLEEMSNNEQINHFFNSKLTNDLSVRTTHIHEIYNHVRYDESYGMITYLVKLINSNQETSGYLFVDINPKYVYDSFFTYDKHQYFNDMETYIYTIQGTYLNSEHNTDGHETYTQNVKFNEVKLSQDKRYLIVSNKIFNENYKVVNLVPMNPLYDKFVSIGFIILSTILLLVLLSSFIAIKIANTITQPLSELHHKLSLSKIDIQEQRKESIPL